MLADADRPRRGPAGQRLRRRRAVPARLPRLQHRRPRLGYQHHGPEGRAGSTADDRRRWDLGVEREDCFFCTSFTITFGGPNLSSTNLGPLKGSIGTIPLRTAPTGEDTGPPSTKTLIDGGNNLPVLVEAQLNGLTVGNTYHFRLVATTNVGTVASADLLFTPTLAPPPPDCPNNQLRAENRSTDLPECRAYEMVTAPNKSSADATLEDYTEDGKSLAFTTVAGNIDQSGQGRAGFPGTST